jgi:hypothetical protein
VNVVKCDNCEKVNDFEDSLADAILPHDYIDTPTTPHLNSIYRNARLSKISDSSKLLTDGTALS